MKKQIIIFYFIALSSIITQAQAPVIPSTWVPNKAYSKGTPVSMTINGTLYCFQYEWDIYQGASPDPSTTAWNGAWSVMPGLSGYKGMLPWLPNAYYKANVIGVSITKNGVTYYYDCLANNASTDPQTPYTDKWKIANAGDAILNNCPNIYTTDYFPLSIAQKNNGFDGTTPPNQSGKSGVVYNGSGDVFMNVNQPRKCLTPLVLYNNELYLRDGCDPNQG